MADVSEHYVSVENLRKAFTYISEVVASNMTNESKIMANLSEMKSSLRINDRTLDNKSVNIEKNIGQYRENCRGCANSFSAVAGRYEGAVGHGASHIRNSVEE